MEHLRENYLKVSTSYSSDAIDVRINGRNYSILYPKYIWSPLPNAIKQSIADHAAFLATNYLPLLLKKKGVIYDTRLPVFEAFSFKSMIYDLPSSAFLDAKNTADYLRDYYNLDFIFKSKAPIVSSKSFKPQKTAIVSFTSGKDSMLTLAVCRELGLQPILISVTEPSNTYELKHKKRILQHLEEEFGITYHIITNELGHLHDAKSLGVEETSLGWGNQLMYYLFLFLPFIFHYRASYLFYGNELSCDTEIVNPEGFRANFCYDQSSHSTTQLDIIMRTLTSGATKVGSLVGPLNEFAIMKCLHEGFPQLAKYQMSCFCDEEISEEYRWCCNCSKCARNYSFLKALGVDPYKLGFWRDMFQEACLSLFSVFNGEQTYGFDRSGLGRGEQELALHLAAQRSPENEFLKEISGKLRYSNNGEHSDEAERLVQKDYNYYCGIHDSQALPKELRQRVRAIYKRILMARAPTDQILPTEAQAKLLDAETDDNEPDLE